MMQLGAILLLLLAASSAQRICYEPGQCSQGDHLNFTLATDYSGCLDACKNYTDTAGDRTCKWFTFHGPEYRVCELFESCSEIFDGCSPSGCLTGEVTCNPKVCDKQGLCVGIMELPGTPTVAVDDDDCAHQCFEHPMCKSYSFCGAELCFMYMETCTTPDSNFTSCHSGEYDCKDAGSC